MASEGKGEHGTHEEQSRHLGEAAGRPEVVHLHRHSARLSLVVSDKFRLEPFGSLLIVYLAALDSTNEGQIVKNVLMSWPI